MKRILFAQNQNTPNPASRIAAFLLRHRHLRSRRGWFNIMCAFIGVLIVMIGLLVILSKQPNFEPTKEEEIGALQKSILEQLSQDPALRGSILNDDTSLINEVIRQIIPGSFNFTTRICSLGNVCPAGFLLNNEVYVDEYIVAANLTEYDPKLVRLYWWEGEFPEGACEWECPTTGVKKCADLSSYKTCTALTGSCVKWSTPTPCPDDATNPDNTMCLNGNCIFPRAILSSELICGPNAISAAQLGSSTDAQRCKIPREACPSVPGTVCFFWRVNISNANPYWGAEMTSETITYPECTAIPAKTYSYSKLISAGGSNTFGTVVYFSENFLGKCSANVVVTGTSNTRQVSTSYSIASLP